MEIKKRYGFNPATNPKKRKKTIKLLERKIELMKEIDKSTLSQKELESYREDLEKWEQLTRIDKSEDSLLFFVYEYLSDLKNPMNMAGNLIPDNQTINDSPEFHRELCSMLDNVSVEGVGKVAWGAPRGHAKSAYLSNAFPLHQIVFNKRKFILVLSETDAISRSFVELVSEQLKFNQKLREDFGELLSPSKQENLKDNLSSFETTTGILVENSSISKQLRGKRNGVYRPDLVICDDLESSKNTNTPELRQKNLDWFNSVLLPIGSPKKTAYLVVGTMVHKDSLLKSIMERSDFQSHLYSAIVSPPEREDLWQEYSILLKDGEDIADKFYEENKHEMDKGVEVLWENHLDYKELMKIKFNSTSKSFASEYMNNPVLQEDSIFNDFTYFEAEQYREIEHRLEFYSAWDIAYGKNKRSDYNAIVTIARDLYTNEIYVVQAWAEKCPASRGLEKAIETIKEFKPKIFVVESVGGQFELYQQLQRRVIKENLTRTRIKPLTTNKAHGNKHARIESLEPYVRSGQLKFRRTQKLLLEQLEMFPFGNHDDLPDALQMAMGQLSLHRRRSWAKKPQGL